MAVKLSHALIAAGCVLALSGCGGNYNDLDAFMAETKARPAGVIQPTPTFKAYKSFTYSAAGLRSPFERPVEVQDLVRLGAGSNVKPDLDRATEYLERFPLDSLNMVGSLEIAGTLWALVQDGAGGVHRVRAGNYMGRNHGRIVELNSTDLTLVEIVPTGNDGWVERPRKLELRTKD